MLEYRVLVHYHNQEGDYTDCDMWQWQDGHFGQIASFSKEDYFGYQGQISYQSELPLNQAHLIVKKTDWSRQTPDYRIQLLPAHLVTEIWLVEGDGEVYYSRQAAKTSPFYHYHNPKSFDIALRTEEFDQKWAYHGWLGARHTESETQFKLWAPTAESVTLILYENAENRAPVWQEFPMERGSRVSQNLQENDHGVWYQVVSGDLDGRAYCYRVDFKQERFITRDPYSEATSENGKRTAILSKESRTPQGFSVKHGKEAKWRLDNPCQAVIYELHVRDLTKSATSGVAENARGTYLGACQKGTKNEAGQSTGFDYIQSLGVNCIQLQPISDRHKQYDFSGKVLYNWGYDPQNYTAPETSLSTDPTNPAQTVKELKTMIQAYHDAGISVIIDVVYNHIYSTFDSPFQSTVPDYYYRMNPDGSFQNGTGVGSETASEHEMFRKYMIDSLKHWIQEYNIDGFRFDLMGIHDVRTMQCIRDEINRIDPRILTYGEGWDMGTGLAPQDKAKKDNAYQLLDVGFFNDNQRDAIKGAEVYGGLKAGFVSGEATEGIIAKAILGSVELGSYLKPNQVLNYVEAHDNYNLHDLFATLHPNDDLDTRRKRIELATAMNLLMQGMTFLELGQEFSRTKLVATGEDGQLTSADKERAMNSYNAPDQVNQVDWNLLTLHEDSIQFIRQVIELKTKHKEFSYETYDEIYQHVLVLTARESSGLVAFEIKDDHHYLIVFNASGENYTLPYADHLRLVLSNNRQISQKVVENLTASIFEVID